MNLSAITASFPIDHETYNELVALCEKAEEADAKSYKLIMNLSLAKDAGSSGFYVLVYNDDTDELIGAATALDIMGFRTFEWSILVDPMYRNIGIGNALYEATKEAMQMRGSDGDLALAVDGAHFSKEFLEKIGYKYSFSEATLEAKAEVVHESLDINVRPFKEEDTQALCKIFSSAFGDLEEESLDLIAYNSTADDIHLWVVERDDAIVGTVSTRKDGDAHWLTALAVHPLFTGQGIGLQIIQWVKEYVVRSGEHHVLLDVEIENERALSIYTKNGFTITTQIHYYAKS